MEKFRDVYVKRSVVLIGIIITMTSILFGNMNTLNAEDAAFKPIGEKVDREYTAFRDASNIPQYNNGIKTGFNLALWVQDVTKAKELKQNNPSMSHEDILSETLEVAYCLNNELSMPPGTKKEFDDKIVAIDPKTGIVKGAQQYFRYIPSDINIREAVYKDRGIDPE